MRKALAATAWAGSVVVAMVQACGGSSSSTSSGQCNCPTATSSVDVQFRCDPPSAPVLTLSGPCNQAGYWSTASNGVGSPIINGTAAGTCHVSLSLNSGETFSTVIAFVDVSFPCGSDPHGCGADIPTTDAGTWMIDNACLDAGAAEAAGPEAGE